jgi:hypothetical protein
VIDWALLPYVLLLSVTAVVVARLHGAPARIYLRSSTLLLGVVAAVSAAAAVAFSTFLSLSCAEVAPASLLLLLMPVAAALAIGRLTHHFGRAVSVASAAVAYVAALVVAVIGAIDLGIVR